MAPRNSSKPRVQGPRKEEERSGGSKESNVRGGAAQTGGTQAMLREAEEAEEFQNDGP